MEIGDIVKSIYDNRSDIGIILDFKIIYDGEIVALVLFSKPEKLIWLDLRDLNGVTDD